MQYRPTATPAANAANHQATTAWFCNSCGSIGNDPGCCCGDTVPVQQYAEASK